MKIDSFAPLGDVLFDLPSRAGARARGYTDSSIKTGMDRRGWAKLEADLDAGKISKIVVWRLDQLGPLGLGHGRLGWVQVAPVEVHE